MAVDASSLAARFPEIADEADGWDPAGVAAKSHQKKPWVCSLGHRWEASIADRTRSGKCPYCSGRRPLAGFNDLATVAPELALQADGWDPRTVTISSGKRLSWKCSLGHQWEARVADRKAGGRSCPVCCNQKVLAGYNDLASKFPEVAAQADGWDPSTVTPKTHKKLRWKCELGHRWEANVSTRTPPMSCGCPVCAGKTVLPGFNDLASLHPDVAAQACGWDPSTATANSNKKRGWTCHLGHQWDAVVSSRTPPLSNGCPYCANQKLLPGYNDLKTCHPELAKEAHGWDPAAVLTGTMKVLAWRCAEGHTWKTSASSRTVDGTGCPSCAKYGFKQAEQAWLYLMQRPGEQQLGITNDPETRLRKHGQQGWQEIQLLGPFPGAKALAAEKALKRWLRTEIGLIARTHENWLTSRLEVQSLQELKRRSGAEFDLF